MPAEGIPGPSSDNINCFDDIGGIETDEYLHDRLTLMTMMMILMMTMPSSMIMMKKVIITKMRRRVGAGITISVRAGSGCNANLRPPHPQDCHCHR